MSTPAVLEDTEWTADAVEVIERLALSGYSFTADDVRRLMRPAPHPNRYGAAFRLAKSRGIIAEVGTAWTSRPVSHGRRIIRWTGSPRLQVVAA